MNSTNLLVLPRCEGVWRLRGPSNASHGQSHRGRTLSVHHEDFALRPRGQVWIPTLHPREGWHTRGRSEFDFVLFFVILDRLTNVWSFCFLSLYFSGPACWISLRGSLRFFVVVVLQAWAFHYILYIKHSVWPHRPSGAGGGPHAAEQAADGHPQPRSRVWDHRPTSCLAPNLSNRRLWLAGRSFGRQSWDFCVVLGLQIVVVLNRTWRLFFINKHPVCLIKELT